MMAKFRSITSSKPVCPGNSDTGELEDIQSFCNSSKLRMGLIMYDILFDCKGRRQSVGKVSEKSLQIVLFVA